MEAASASVAGEAPEQLLDRVQDLQERLDGTGDEATRAVADALVSAVVQMYGAGLERIIGHLLTDSGEGSRLARELSEDAFLSTLLLIHDLHPVALPDRVQSALDSVRPYMESHGGSVELLSVEGGIARIHLRGSCSDCSASAVTLELAIKQALEEAAPDLEGLEVEGMGGQSGGDGGLPMATGTGNAGVELPMVSVTSGGTELPAVPPSAPAWFEVGVPAELGEGGLRSISVADRDLVIAQVDGTLLAYRDMCADCGQPLHDGVLSAGALRCPHCDRSFFLPRAGRSMDDDGLQLEPVPLLRDDSGIRVALAA
jgi:Fe-S cluster biogenesis protein NfuA/nitrite reductase/ring-hydroxylating ferredoxin subunit